MTSKSNHTPGFGIDYEVLMPAYFALKLNKENIEDFQIQSNVDDMGNMDDVVIDVTKKRDTSIFCDTTET
jgi:hypothetical protein